MALSLYKLDPNNGCSFGGTTIDSIVDWTINESATTLDGTSDGVVTVQSVHVDNQVCDITITTKNPENFNSISVGDCGTLILKGVKRACGDSVDTTPVTLTATSANSASVTSIDRGVPHEGDSTGNITFRVGNATGAAIFAYT